MTAITRENIDALLDAGRIEVAMRSGAWWSIRRNGATRTWKRDAERVYLPIKYGFRMTTAITEADFRKNGALDPSEYRVKA